MDLTEGEEIKLKIDRVSGSGNPLAEFGSTHIKVQGANPGDVVLARITKPHGHMKAELVDVIERGPDASMPQRQKEAVLAHQRYLAKKAEQRIRSANIDDSEDTESSSTASESLQNMVDDLDMELETTEKRADATVTEIEEEIEDENRNDLLKGKK